MKDLFTIRITSDDKGVHVQGESIHLSEMNEKEREVCAMVAECITSVGALLGGIPIRPEATVH